MLFNTVQALYTVNPMKKTRGLFLLSVRSYRDEKHIIVLPLAVNVGNSRNIFVASPDNESFLKYSRHRVTCQFFALASMTR